MILYDLKVELNNEDCFQSVRSSYGKEAQSRATILKLFREFKRGKNSLQNKEYRGRPLSALVPVNVSKKTLTDDNRRTFQIIQKELKLGYTPIPKIIHEELYIKKFSLSL